MWVSPRQMRGRDLAKSMQPEAEVIYMGPGPYPGSFTCHLIMGYHFAALNLSFLLCETG